MNEHACIRMHTHTPVVVRASVREGVGGSNGGSEKVLRVPPVEVGVVRDGARVRAACGLQVSGLGLRVEGLGFRV
jgi:hypothetical protein